MTTTLGGWSPFGLALAAVATFAALYEPIRQNLLHGETAFDVGGVGGVGGLANMVAPPSDNCADGFQGNYCYQKGVLFGLTPFALGTLFFWVGPLLLACLVIACSRSARCSASTQTALEGQDEKKSQSWLPPVWFGLNLLWFSVPMVSFGFGLREIQGPPFVRVVLAIALAASHPLSWNLSLVMIPTGGIVSKLVLLGPDEWNQWFDFHRLLGYTTGFWALLHGSTELVYLMTNKERFKSLWDVRNNGETLLYWAGMVCLTLMVTQVGVAYLRRMWKPRFQTMHGILAATLLVVATIHWSPFALFFIPATALHAMTLANRLVVGMRQQQSSLSESSPAPSSIITNLEPHQAATLLGASLVASLCGLSLVWSQRDRYMILPTANLYVPFIFPTLSVIASFLLSLVTSVVGLRCLHRPQEEEDNNIDDMFHYNGEQMELEEEATTPLVSLSTPSEQV